MTTASVPLLSHEPAEILAPPKCGDAAVAVYALADGVQLAHPENLLNDNSVVAGVADKHFKLSGFARLVLLQLESGPASLAELGKSMAERLQQEEIDEESLDAAVNKLLSIGLLSCSDAARRPAPSRTSRKNSTLLHRYLSIRIPLIPRRVVAALSRPVIPLLYSPAVALLFPLMFAAQVLFVIRTQKLLLQAHSFTGPTFWFLLAGNYLGLLFHELGHASACLKGGGKPGPIGFCVYLGIPAFYADVSAAWLLPRTRRALVDLGGMYFSLILASICSLLFVMLHIPVLGVLALLFDVTVVWNLNPFIRMDGYWLLSDVFGLHNLIGSNKASVRWCLRRVCGYRELPPPVFSRSYKFRTLYVLYLIGFVGFTSLFAYKLFFSYFPHLLHICYSAVQAFLAHKYHVGKLSGKMVASFVGSIASLAALSIYICRLVSSAARMIMRKTNLLTRTP